MPITELVQGAAAIKAAMDIAKGLQSLDMQMETATLKMRLAEIMISLADAKASLAESQERFTEKDNEIKRLTEALEIKAKVFRNHDAYYEVDELGNAKGAPFCSRCWEADHRLIHLSLGWSTVDPVHCPQCKANYDGERIIRFFGT
jgi:hypothetical protein